MINSTLERSPKTATATARHISASRPAHSPLSSGAAKPAKPVVTPHFRKPLFLTSSRVPAFAEKANTETARIDNSFFILFPLVLNNYLNIFFQRIPLNNKINLSTKQLILLPKYIHKLYIISKLYTRCGGYED